MGHSGFGTRVSSSLLLAQDILLVCSDLRAFKQQNKSRMSNAYCRPTKNFSRGFLASIAVGLPWKILMTISAAYLEQCQIR